MISQRRGDRGEEESWSLRSPRLCERYSFASRALCSAKLLTSAGLLSERLFEIGDEIVTVLEAN